jgi:hypothetical protein
MKVNPFKPSSIVHPGMFAGRLKEIQKIERLLYQTKNGNSSSFIVHGERGIGKSSLMYYIDAVARGKISSLDDISYNFMVVSISLEPHDTYKDVIYKIAREFQHELADNEKLKSLLKSIWDFISNWEIMGVRYHKVKDELEPEVMIEELANKLLLVLEKTKSVLDGIYIFIDEADKPTVNPNLGVFVKYLTERLQKRDIHNIGIGIIGISTMIDKIRESHESALRIFSFFSLDPLIPADREMVIDLGLKEANARNTVATSISDDAKSLISNFSEGYPHFLQQYAYSAFEADDDDTIDRPDVINGLFSPYGALHQLGERYFDSMYFKDIYSDDYRIILQVMAAHTDEYISKKKIISQTGLHDYTVQNAITAFMKKGLLVLKPGSRGLYKLPSNSFKVWILTFASADSKAIRNDKK